MPIQQNVIGVSGGAVPMPATSAVGALKNDGSNVISWDDTITHASEWNNKTMPANSHGSLHNDGAGNLSWELPVSLAIGDASAKTVGTIYQAASDGFVVTPLQGTGAAVGSKILTDSNATPTTFMGGTYLSSGTGTWTGCCVPVKKNNYYKVEATSGSPTLAYFIPLA